MKILNFKYLLVLLASVILVSSCDKDDDGETEVSSFVGSYVITSAEVAEAFTLSTTAMEIPVPAGTVITTQIQAALTGAVECSSPDKTLVELKEDKTIYMSCDGENALNAGTWEEVDETTLKLNMNSTAIPSSPSGFVLSVSDIVIDATTLSGTTSVPMPKEMFTEMVAAYGLTLADSPTVYNVSFDITFTKK